MILTLEVEHHPNWILFNREILNVVERQIKNEKDA